MDDSVRKLLDWVDFEPGRESAVVDIKNPADRKYFWNYWHTNKEFLKSKGFSMSKESDGNFYIHHVLDEVQKQEKEKREETLKLSRASSIDVDINIPSPSGLSYFPYQKAGILFISKKESSLLADEMGVGKMEFVDNKVFTPDGRKRFGDLVPGDFVIGRDGKPTQVTGVFPQEPQELYRVTMNDGFSVDVGLGHLWYVESPCQKNRNTIGVVLSTEQLLDEEGFIERNGVDRNSKKTYKIKTYYKKSNGDNAWSIPVVEPIQFEPKKVEVDPYLLGVILGDGSILKSGLSYITCHEDDRIELLSRYDEGFTVTYRKNTRIAKTKLIKPKNALKGMGLAGSKAWEKFVPENYKYNSVEVRLSLLQGLMDTDGFAGKTHTEYSTTSKNLCDDIVEITQSLGGIARVKTRVSKYTYKGEKKEGRPSYRVNIKLPSNMCPFRLKRKANRYAVPTKYKPSRYITDIQKVPGVRECMCISVKASDSLYVTEYAIVTHNTIQVIGAINLWNRESKNIKNVLVICPSSLRLNWKREFEKWLVKDYSVGVVNRTVYPESVDIVIINFDVVHKHHDVLTSKTWDLLVIDEVHFLKSKSARRSKYIFGSKKDKIKEISASKKVFLSGTPMVNKPIELFPIISALDPETWSSQWKYAQRYCDPVHNGWGWDFNGASNLEELQDKLRSTIMIRRLKADVLSELPAKMRQVVELPADEEIFELIRSELSEWSEREKLIADLKASVLMARINEDKADYKDAVEKLKEGMSTSFGSMAKLREKVALAKLPYVLEHLQGIDGKVVVFAHHKSVIKKLKEKLGDAAVVIMGETPLAERQDAVDSFQTNESVKYFIGSIMAAGVGITLTASSHVVFAELDWVPGVINQCEDRSHRIGQKNSVLVQHLVLEGSLDAKMAKTLIQKQEVIDKALDLEYSLEEASIPDEIVLPVEKELKKAAENISHEEKQELLEKLRLIAALDSDRASHANNVGFNRMDSAIGHSLASQMFLSDRQAVVAKILVGKYRRQIQ